ncbi:MAG: DMT family transporter [Clostridiales bacterium]|nr:DMT family transporter [Clostridiales bacterium]
MNSKNSERIGALCVIGAAILFGIMPLMAKIAYANGGNAFSVSFGRFISAAVMAGIMVGANPKVDFAINRTQLKDIFLLSVFYALTPVFLYMSYEYIDSSLASTLHFTYPIIVTVIMVVFFKARLDLKQLLCMALCIAGILMLYKPGENTNLTGMIIAMISGTTYGLYMIFLGRSCLKGVPYIKLTFWITLISGVEIGIAGVIFGKMDMNIGLTGWIAILGLGLFSTVFALALFQRGVFMCGEIKTSLLSTFEPLTGVFVGVFAFNEILKGRTVLGVVMILASTVILVIPSRDDKKAH